MFGGRISMFLRYRNYVLRYKSAYYKSNTRLYGNVFSIQYSVFSLLLPLSV